MNPIFNNAKTSSGRPPAAVELSPEGVLAAALGSGEGPAYAFAPLRPGAIVPGIGEPNIRAAEEVSAGIRSALNQVGPRSRFVSLVLPDTAVRNAGYEPGAVLPSSLAALDAVDSMEALLTASLTPLTLTTSIANGSDLLLHRTLDLPENPAEHIAEIQRGIAVAAAYFEDKLQGPARTLHYAGCYPTSEFANWIDAPEMTVVDLVPRPQTGLTTALGTANIAGATGALAGAS